MADTNEAGVVEERLIVCVLGCIGELQRRGERSRNIGWIFGTEVPILQLHYWVPTSESVRYWFSQANHIFSRLRVTSNFEDYCTSLLHRRQLLSVTCSSSCELH
jgi:hypothetical protein